MNDEAKIFTDDANRANKGLQLKDISDWLKIGLLLIGAGIGYSKLSDKVDAHTAQLEQVRSEVSSMRSEANSKNENQAKTIGRIEMYLSSKDRDYWRASSGRENQ